MILRQLLSKICRCPQQNPPETTLYLARHGETEENVQFILQGLMPGHLTQKGIAQAEALCQSLSETSFDAILCSDLQRCRDTADIVMRGRSEQLIIEPLLRERDWGTFTGKKLMQIRGLPFPPDVESEESLFARAERFLDLVQEHYAGKRVLAISHGLFCRAIQADFQRKTIHDIPRMNNAEVRILSFKNRKMNGGKRGAADEVSAN